MEKKTAKELIEIIEKNDLLEAIFHQDFDYDEDEWIENLGLGEMDEIDGRYDTSEFWQVIYFKDHNVYLKIYGEYDSYGQGEHEYEGIYEVKPKEVKTIIYE